MENIDPFDVITTQLRTQQVIDLVRGGQAGPHILHDFLKTLNSEQFKTAMRLVQKNLEQK